MAGAGPRLVGSLPPNRALIKNQHAKGNLPRVHGWLYRVETGKVDVLVDGRSHE